MNLSDNGMSFKGKRYCVDASPVTFRVRVSQAEIKHYSWDHPVSLTNRYRKEREKDYQIYYRT